jgi:hypothetical protein
MTQDGLRRFGSRRMTALEISAGRLPIADSALVLLAERKVTGDLRLMGVIVS